MANCRAVRCWRWTWATCWGGSTARLGVEPLTGLAGVWIDATRVEEAELRGFVVLEPAELIARQVEAVFRQHAPELLGRTEVQQLLDTLSRSHPGLVEDVTPRHLPLTSVQAVLQQLIAENVSIRDTRTLFETLAARAPKSQSIDDLMETVRAALGRSIVDRLFEGSDTLQVIGLAAATETRLLNEMGDEGEALLTPATLEALNDAAERAVAEQEGAGYPPVLLDLARPARDPVASVATQSAAAGGDCLR